MLFCKIILLHPARNLHKIKTHVGLIRFWMLPVAQHRIHRCAEHNQRRGNCFITSLRVITFTSAKSIMEQDTLHIPDDHELLRSIVDFTPDAIISSNEKGLLVYWNQAAEKMFGYTADEVIGCDMAETLLPNDLQDRVRAVFTQGPPQVPRYGRAVRSKARRKDGTIFDVELSLSCRCNGQKGFYTAIVRDITDTVSCENRIACEKEYLEKVIQRIEDGFFVCDQKGYITRINKKAETLIGYPHDEIIGRHVTDFVADGFKPGTFLLDLYEAGYVENYTSTWQRKDGTSWNIEASISLMQDDENAVFAVSTIRDISDKVKLDEVKKRYHARVFLMREQEKKRFSQRLHDALSPAAISVSAKLRFLENALAENNTSKAREMIDDIESTYMESLSTLRHIAIQLRPGTIDQLGLAITLTRECVEISESTGISVTPKINIDEDRISESVKTVVYRVVMEALGNVIKHSGARHAIVHLKVHRSKYLLLEITDDGKGFDVQKVLQGDMDEITLGVTGMVENIEGINGTISIESSETGTRIAASVPLWIEEARE